VDTKIQKNQAFYSETLRKFILSAVFLYTEMTGFILPGKFFKTEYTDIAVLPTSTPLVEWEYKTMFVIGNDNVGLM
jgi:hypothetical protein